MPTMQTQSTSMIRLEQVDHADPDLMMVTVTEDLKETTLKADPVKSITRICQINFIIMFIIKVRNSLILVF